MDLALNNLQRLMSHKTQSINQPIIIVSIIVVIVTNLLSVVHSDLLQVFVVVDNFF